MNAKIVLLFAVVLVCAVDAEVSSTCERGSSYWCENYKQAKECGALEPCMKYVWKPRIGEDPCDVCHKSVKIIHDYVVANVTQKHFMNAIQDIFSQLETKEECVSLVFKDDEEFLFQQFKKLVSFSNLWCAEPLLCESNQEESEARKNRILKDFIQDVTEHFSKSKLDPMCINCQLIVTQLTNLIKNKVTQKIVRDLIKGPCLYAKRLEKQCAALVDVYVEILFMSAIDSMTPAEKACIGLSFCKLPDCTGKLTVPSEDRHTGIADEAGNIEMANTGKEIFFCETCMLTVQYWETILHINQTMEVLKLGLIRMCDALPLEYDEQCQKMSAQYGDRIVNLLHHYQNPHLVCTFLFVCSPEVLQGLTNSSILVPFCDTCKGITTFLIDKLRLNSSEKSMEENLKIVCETLPNDREQYCKAIVENYGKIILQFTKDTKIPKKICQRLLLCSVMSNTRTPSLSVSHCQGCQDTAITMPEIDVCPLCQRVVKTVERFLRLNETVLTIKNIVSTVCVVLPMKQERTCFVIFNHFADEINRRVVFYQNPIIVCKALLYCPPDASSISKPTKQIVCEGCSPLEEAITEFLPTSYSKELVKLTAQNVCLDLKVKKIQPRVLCSANRPSSLSQVKDNSVCDICKQVVAYLEGVFKLNQTIAVLKTAVVDVCSIFPAIQELQCREQISQYADNIISMVQLRMKPSAICKLVFVCSSSPSVSLVKSKENAVCDTCKQVVAFLRGVFRVNQTMQAMKSAVAGVCVILPIKQEIECKVLVTGYADHIIWYVQQNINPVVVCETLLKCPAKTPVALPQSETLVCKACQRIIAVIEVVFNLNRTENIITYIENNLCAILPEDREKQCKDVLNRDSSLIIKMLRDRTKPNVICHFIFSCPTTRTSKTLHKITSGNTVVCTTCKKVVAFLESLLQLNISEVSIKFTIKSLCILLPPERQPKCLETVDNIFDALVEMVRNRTKPGVICETIFLCSSSEVMAVEEVRGEWVCETCRQIMNMMENPYWINRREAHVMFALTRGCKLLPKLEEAMCKKTVYVYKNHIMIMIRTRKNPKMICKKFTVCPASVMVESKAKVSKPEAVLCDTCKQVVAYLEGVIKINSSLQVIKGAVETMCTILPRNQELICKVQVKQYANTIIALALKGTHPAVICQILRLCPIPAQPTSITTIKEDSLCDACKQAVAFVVGAYQINETLEAIKTVAMQMCTILPMHQELQCIESISKQAENIIALIKMRLNPTSVCQALSCCPERLVKKINMVKDDTRCITCKQVVGFLEETFQLNQTIAATEVALKEVCSIFPFDREKQCQEAIARYAKQIVVMIQLRIDPDTICKALNLCSTVQALSVSKPKSNVICDTCTHVVAYLEGAFRINQTLEAIRLVVLQACKVLPESQEADCVKNFMEYSDNIFKMIQVRMNPSAICYILFLCPPSRACETCKQVTAYVEGTFGLNQTMAALKGSVLNVCSIFPVKQEIQCKELLSHNADNIIAMVQMRLKPSAICKVLLFCTVPAQLRKTSRYNSGPYCALCKAGVNYAEQVYSAKKNEKMLRSAVGTMCQRFPTQYIMKCNGMVYEYGENIMYKLRQSQHPAIICQTLDLCVNDVKWSRSGCQNGEEYWCASFSNALQCKALKYCNHIRA